MNRNYPIALRATLLAAVMTFAGTSGCKSQGTAFTNPFVAPDRVPPPATRTLLPGQASPYYPGDPLPSMQSARATQAPTVTSTTPIQQPPTPSVNAASRQAVVASNESAVAIPADGDALRFALPKPAPPTTVAQPAGQVAAAATSRQAVSPASFGQPAPGAASFTQGQPTPAGVMSPNSQAPTSTGPWRSPQIARQNVAPPQPLNLGPPPGSPPIALAPTAISYAPATVAAAPTATMPVSLRAVASPPIESVVESPSPRIRLPGYAAPEQNLGPQPGAVQQAAYYSAGTTPAVGLPQYNGSVVQTVQVTPLPANMYPPTVAALNTGDGFRPRGSMR